MANEKIPRESRTEALQMAKRTQQPGQTTAQTKIIVQGIERGINEYKRLQKVKARERAKVRIKRPQNQLRGKMTSVLQKVPWADRFTWLPWVLLAVSLIPWVMLAGSFVYFAFSGMTDSSPS